MADNRWYLAVQGNRIGPLPEDQLPELVQEGKLEPETLVWRKGMSAWQPAREVPEMRPLLGSGAAAETPKPAPEPAPAEAKPAPAGAWFVAEGGTKLGPLPFDRLETLAREGRIEADTLVWRKGMGDWKPAKDVPDVAALLAARPTAAPAPDEAVPAEARPEIQAKKTPEHETGGPASGSATGRWYVAHEGDRLGPFSKDALADLVSDGRLAPATLVWHKGLSAWKPAQEVSELSDLLAAAPAAQAETAWEAEGESADESPAQAAAAPEPESGEREQTPFHNVLQRIEAAAKAPAEASPETEAAPAEKEALATGAGSSAIPEEPPLMEGLSEEPAPIEAAPVDESAETVVEPAEETSVETGPSPDAEAAPAETSGPRPAEDVLAQQGQEAEEPEAEWAPVAPTAPAGAPEKPIGAQTPPGKPPPEKPRKKASALILLALALAALGVCLPLVYAAFVHVVKGSQPNPFARVLPPAGADVAAWGVTVFLPFLGILTALFAPFRVRWAHAGQLVFWMITGAGLGTALQMRFEALTQAVLDLFKQAQADAAAVPALVEAFQWCEQQAVSRLPFLWMATASVVAIAAFGVIYLLWRYPRVKWAPLSSTPSKPSARKGATAPAPIPPPKEGFAPSRALCRLVFLGWVFLFLPWWILNELIAGLKWSPSLLVPAGRAIGLSLPLAPLSTFLHILPVLAVIGMGMVLPRWRPYRGEIRTARLLGLLSLLLFVLTCGLLPASHLMRRTAKPPPAPEPAEAPAETPAETAAPAEPGPPPVGLTPAQAETQRTADAKVLQATALIQELQAGVKGGSTGLKPKADRADGLLGEAIGLYEKIQVELEGAGTPIPAGLLHELKRATEARKALRMLRGEMK